MSDFKVAVVVISFIIFVIGVVAFVGLLVALPFAGADTLAFPIAATSLVISVANLLIQLGLAAQKKANQ